MNKMKSIISISALAALIGFTVITSTSAQEIKNSTWSQSYESYRQDIKQMPKKDRTKCEQLLNEVLNDLDTKNKCNTDEDCTLLDQDPFGNTAPILKREAKETKSKMRKYNENCVDPSKRFVPNRELVHLPVCWKNKCMVKTK